MRDADLELLAVVLDRLATSRLVGHQFLRAALERPMQREQWLEAIDALTHLADARSERYRVVARMPRAVQAIQGIAGLGLWLPDPWLSVLIVDASEASLDALVPQVALAHQAGDERLDQLADLLVKVGTSPNLDVLRSRVQQHREERSARLFGELARSFGLKPTTPISFTIELESSTFEKNSLLARIEANSMNGSPLAVQLELSPRGRARVLPVGRIEPRDLPAKLAEVAKEYGVTWSRSASTAGKRSEGVTESGLLRWLLPAR